MSFSDECFLKTGWPIQGLTHCFDLALPSKPEGERQRDGPVVGLEARGGSTENDDFSGVDSANFFRCPCGPRLEQTKNRCATSWRFHPAKREVHSVDCPETVFDVEDAVDLFCPRGRLLVFAVTKGAGPKAFFLASFSAASSTDLVPSRYHRPLFRQSVRLSLKENPFAAANLGGICALTTPKRVRPFSACGLYFSASFPGFQQRGPGPFGYLAAP